MGEGCRVLEKDRLHAPTLLVVAFVLVELFPSVPNFALLHGAIVAGPRVGPSRNPQLHPHVRVITMKLIERLLHEMLPHEAVRSVRARDKVRVYDEYGTLTCSVVGGR